LIKKASPTQAATVSPAIIIIAVELSPGCMKRFMKKSFTVPAINVVIVDVTVVVIVIWAVPDISGGKIAIIA